MSIRKILSPLLIISYACGSRVYEFSANVPRQRFGGSLYMLLLWSLYNFILIYGVIPATINYSILYHISFGANIFIAFLSIINGIYYNKTFRNCIKNLTTVDDTLEKLGPITNYKVYIKTIGFILGWLIIFILIIYLENLSLKRLNYNIAQTIYIPVIRTYCYHINIINDLIITSMLGFVELKFDQINVHLEKLTEDNKCKINKRAWEHSVLVFHQSRYTNVPKSAYIIWIVISLHSELRKISRKIDLIFGTQMTIEMGSYFFFTALGIQEIFDVVFIKDYNNDKLRHTIIMLLWLFIQIFRLFLINYECEKIDIKANATGNFISNLSYSNCDVEIRENILQFLLMTQSPIKFYGLGLFQFGFKFLQGFTTSIATVLVILLQAYIHKYTLSKNCND